MKIPLKKVGKVGSSESRERQEPLEEGKYRVEVTEANEAEDKYGGFYMRLKVLQGEYEGREVRVRIFPPGKYGPSKELRTLIETLGGDPEEEEFEFDLDGLNGTVFNVYLGIQDKGEQGKFNRATKFSAAPKSKGA